MLDAWVIEELRRKEREKLVEERIQLPLEAPRQMPVTDAPPRREDTERGVAIIPL